MRVKKFEAKNMKDALQMVKNELGPDAVILSARDNRRSYGIGGEASVEITAAVSESTLQKKRFVESRMTHHDRDRFQKSDARTQRQIIDRMVESRARPAPEEKTVRPITRTSYIDIHDEEIEAGPRRTEAMQRARGRIVSDLLDDFSQEFHPEAISEARQNVRRSQPVQASHRAPVQTPATAARQSKQMADESQASLPDRALTRIRSAAREAWRANPFMEEEAPAQPRRSVSGTGGLESVSAGTASVPVSGEKESEIASLKNEIHRLQASMQEMLKGFQKVPQTFTTMHPGAEFGISYDLSFMFQKLTEAGITVDNTVEMLQQAAKELDPVQAKKRPIVDAWVARYLLNSIHVVQNPWQGRVHLFVGGSGSGKTSSLIKIASHLVVKEKKRIAILSTDSFKVGAVDQLKIYCQILNVPFAVIRNKKDWEWVMGQLNHIDHILVDFPGLQLREIDEIHLLKSLLPPEGLSPVTHFCISATSKDGDAYEIARRYKVAGFQDLIFTNLDQSVQHGIIHNLQKKTGQPLHSFGTGNRIPEDFEVASKERVLDLIFKLTKLRRETT